MSLKINKQIADLERRKKFERDLDKSLGDGLAQGLLSGNNASYEREIIPPEEIAFLAEVKHRNLVSENEILDCARDYRIPDERIYLLKDQQKLDWLSDDDKGFLEKLESNPNLLTNLNKVSELCERGYIEQFDSAEKRFFADISKSQITIEKSSKLDLLAKHHNIDESKCKYWLNSGQIAILNEPEKQWLGKVQEGASLATLEVAQKELGLQSTWHLKDRISIDNQGNRSVNFNPMVANHNFRVNLKPKINWYQKDYKIPSRLPNFCSKDLKILAADGEDLNYWQQIRKDHLSRQKGTLDYEQSLFSSLPPMQQAGVLAQNPCDLNSHGMRARNEVLPVFSDTWHEQHKQKLISNNEYFFLASLRRNQDIKQLEKSRQIYKCNPESLKARGYIDFLSRDEHKCLMKLVKEEYQGGKDELVEDLKRRHFFIESNPSEKRLLSYLKNHKISSREGLFVAADNFMVSKNQLKSMKSKGFINYLEDHELDYLKATLELPKEEHSQIASKYGIENPWFLDRYRTKDENKKATIKENISIDASPKHRTNPRVLYMEDRSLLEFRQNRATNFPIDLKASDCSIYINGNSSLDGLNFKDIERYYEIKSKGLGLRDLPLLSNTESAFLSKILFRDFEPECFKKIAKDDFNLPESTVDKLMDLGFLEKSEKNGKSVSKWHEPKTLHDARVWLNLSDRRTQWAKSVIEKIGIDTPSVDLRLALKGKTDPAPFKPKIMDYSIYFKSLRDEALTNTEQIRLREMRQNGIHPESPDFQKWIKEEPASWRMKKARLSEYLKHYEKAYGINKEALKFTNTFKQVSHDQLKKIGLSDQEIQRYVEGISGKHQILQKHALKTPKGRPIIYYSITHEGPISGRSFIEQDTPKKEIAKRPQQRQDLLFHDLKVVDSVIAVIDQKKKEGWKVKEIRNEASQYAINKKGLQNDQRKGGPAFMDAVLIFEEETSHSQGGGGGRTETIAVEYGNYELERMASKLTNSDFDHAYVFARKDYTERYQRHFSVPNVTYRSI